MFANSDSLLTAAAGKKTGGDACVKLSQYVRRDLFRRTKFFCASWEKYSDAPDSMQRHVVEQLKISGGGIEHEQWWDENWKSIRTALNQKRDSVAAAVARRFKGEFVAELNGLL